MTLVEAYDRGGWLLAAAAGVTLVLRLWRVDAWQLILPRWLQWARWPRWLQYLVLFVASLISATLTGMSAGQPWGLALLAAVPVALGAHCLHEGTRAVGHAMTARALAADWQYKPSRFRRAASIVVPLNRDAIMAHNVAAKTHAHRKPMR